MMFLQGEINTTPHNDNPLAHTNTKHDTHVNIPHVHAKTYVHPYIQSRYVR